MANIDSELALLRDAKDGDANTSREAICSALREINKERTYPPAELVATENGEYDAPEGGAYTTVTVDVHDDITKSVDGFVNDLRITENGFVFSHEKFPGKNIVIEGFEVAVPQIIRNEVPLSVDRNGTYEAQSNECYSPVVVDIPETPHEGDYLTATMYFNDPNNPNELSLIFIDKDEHILFGESARSFLDRFPKFKQINHYIHMDWNPEPNKMLMNQWYIPSWVYAPNTEIDANSRTIDYDVFLYIAQHNVMDLFFDFFDDEKDNFISVNISGIVFLFKYISHGFTDADGHKFNYCFSLSSNEDDTEYGFNYPMYCASDTSDINMQTFVDGDKPYWWGCSLARAQINGNRNLLVRQNDRDIYDHSGWDINNLVPQEMLDDIVPVAHYVIHPSKVDSNSPFKTKTVPRKNLSIVQGDTTYRRVTDPDPGANPSEEGWYEYNSEDEYFFLTSDISVVSQKKYYYQDSSYTIDVEHLVSDDISDKWQSTGWSNYDLNLRHSPILFVRQVSGEYKAYKSLNTQYVEYTAEDHIKYVNAHPDELAGGSYYPIRIWTMYGLADKIRDLDSPSKREILLENLYCIDNSHAVYLYDRDLKIYYVSDISKNDDEYTYNNTVRYTAAENPSRIADIDEKIRKHVYTPSYEIHFDGYEEERTYNEEFDIWPDERYIAYASGDYLTRELNEEHISFYYKLANNTDYDKFIFFNYNDVVNGFNTCPPAYHFVKNGNGDYVIERIDTEYTGHTSETVEYKCKYTHEKIYDKFLVAPPDNLNTKSYLYAPAYYGSIHIDFHYNWVRSYSIIDTPLIEYIEPVTAIVNETKNPMEIISDINEYDYYDGLNSFMDKSCNYNSNIFADEYAIKMFKEAKDKNDYLPQEYPLLTYQQAEYIMNDRYNHFEVNYTILGPHNSYSVSGSPKKYQDLYFFI